MPAERICCTIPDCRRTGTKSRSARPFICAYHWLSVEMALRQAHAKAAAMLRRRRDGATIHIEARAWQAVYDRAVARVGEVRK